MFFFGGLGADSALSMRGRVWLAVAVVVSLAVLATAGQASGQRDGVRAVKCAKVKVRATPNVNTAMVPETIKSAVTNCSSAKETVTVTQTMAGPSVSGAPMAKIWTITLLPGKTAVKTRSFPYACCGTYTVKDRVFTRSGRLLAHAEATFTFA